MYKYQEIINKLTIQQKLSILADVRGFSDQTILESGVPSIKTASLKELNDSRDKAFPSFESMALGTLDRGFTLQTHGI